MGGTSGLAPENIRYFVDNRLKYYKHKTRMDWDEHWEDIISPELYPPQSVGLGVLSFISDCMPKNGKILEAGCGMGHIVHELRMQGFDCEGVDNAGRTIGKIREILPDLPVFEGDVLSLAAPDDLYSGYISLGVVEHREEGPKPFLREAWRVLRKGGVAVFTVPYCSTIRQIKGRLGCFSSRPGSDYVFYQQAFTREEFSDILRQEGFTVTDHTYYDPWKGLKDELQPFRYLKFAVPGLGGQAKMALSGGSAYARGNLRQVILYTFTFYTRPSAGACPDSNEISSFYDPRHVACRLGTKRFPAA